MMEQAVGNPIGEDEMVKIVKTVCPLCAMRCGIDVHVSGDAITKVTPMKEHVLRHLCVKAAAIPELQHSKDRLLYPQKRVNGGWESVSWEEAFDFVITRLNYIRDRYGPQALTLMYGHSLWNKEAIPLIKTFAKAYKTPNITIAGDWCVYSSILADRITFGGTWLVPDLSKAKCILNWATNTWNSRAPARHLYRNLKEQGIKLIVIDPRVTHEAKLADLHLRPRPGTDLALMLAMIHVIISEDLYDKDFVTKWAIGFDKLSETIKEYTPQWAEGVTGVPAQDIVECARIYATIKPACINVFSAGLDQHSNAFQTTRAKNVLIAITGNFETPGGNKSVPLPPGFLKWHMHDEEYNPEGKTYSSDRYPLWDLLKEAHALLFAETVMTSNPYPVRGLICQACNPARTVLNTNKMKKALKELELLVVMDVFMSDTAELADIVLPAATGLETRFVTNYWSGHLPLVLVSNKVFEPAGECWADGKFWLELGKRMGYDSFFPWRNTDEIIEDVLRSVGKTSEDMKVLPQGYFYELRPLETPVEKQFKTPSGKMEIYSDTLETLGYPPLPVYGEPLESPVSTPDLFKEYPLIVITGTRHEAYEHSWGRNLPMLRSKCPEPEIEMHPKDADENGVSDGEWVIIESPVGVIKMKARVTEDIMEGVVSMPHGWGGASNVNILTNDELLDPITGAPNSKSILCRVKKASASSNLSL